MSTAHRIIVAGAAATAAALLTLPQAFSTGTSDEGSGDSAGPAPCTQPAADVAFGISVHEEAVVGCEQYAGLESAFAQCLGPMTHVTVTSDSFRQWVMGCRTSTVREAFADCLSPLQGAAHTADTYQAWIDGCRRSLPDWASEVPLPAFDGGE